VGTRCADHVTPLYPQKLALTSPTGGGRSVGIVRVRTKATEFSLVSQILVHELKHAAVKLFFVKVVMTDGYFPLICASTQQQDVLAKNIPKDSTVCRWFYYGI